VEHCWTFSRRQMTEAAGGTKSGTDNGGLSVWIPLTRVQHRLDQRPETSRVPQELSLNFGPPPFPG
jgi:hypothetical protein